MSEVLIRTKRWLEIALLINDARSDDIQSEYATFCKSRNSIIDNTKTISAFLRSKCYEHGIAIGPINLFLEADHDISEWLTNLETEVIPYMIREKILKITKD